MQPGNPNDQDDDLYWQPTQYQDQQYPYQQPQQRQSGLQQPEHPQYPYHQTQQYTPPPIMPPPQPKRPWYKRTWTWYRARSRRTQIIIAAAIILFVLTSAIVGAVSPSTPSQESASTPVPTEAPDLGATAMAQNTPVVEQPTQALQPTQAPTQSPAQAEATFKASAKDTTVATLDKDGNSDQGNIVHFTATIFNFVKDSSGNTAGANVNDPNSSGVIQVAFPTGTDLSQLNTGDTIEIWGSDDGTSSGTNAFGATIQEVVVSANYMTDKTTGYQAG